MMMMVLSKKKARNDEVEGNKRLIGNDGRRRQNRSEEESRAAKQSKTKQSRDRVGILDQLMCSSPGTTATRVTLLLWFVRSFVSLITFFVLAVKLLLPTVSPVLYGWMDGIITLLGSVSGTLVDAQTSSFVTHKAVMEAREGSMIHLHPFIQHLL